MKGGERDMSSEEQRKVMKKIKKLLDLAGSANEHEAELAAQMAQELLEKYRNQQ